MVCIESIGVLFRTASVSSKLEYELNPRLLSTLCIIFGILVSVVPFGRMGQVGHLYHVVHESSASFRLL